MNGLAEVEPRRIYRLEKSNSHWNANYKKASVKDADGNILWIFRFDSLVRLVKIRAQWTRLWFAPWRGLYAAASKFAYFKAQRHLCQSLYPCSLFRQSQLTLTWPWGPGFLPWNKTSGGEKFVYKTINWSVFLINHKSKRQNWLVFYILFYVIFNLFKLKKILWDEGKNGPVFFCVKTPHNCWYIRQYQEETTSPEGQVLFVYTTMETIVHARHDTSDSPIDF